MVIGSQPVPMESFLEKQREQAKFMRLQQKESTENLHKFKSANDVVANALGHSVKDELKNKEQEAAANLHNYRGQPQDFMSHQVKNHLNHNAANKTNLVADVVAPIAGKRLDTVEGKCVSQALKDDGNSSVPSSSDRGRSGSQSTADWSVISGHEFSSDRGLTSTPVNIDMSEISGFLRNGADVAAGANALSLKSFGGDDTPLSSSYVDASAEMDEKNWKLSFITVAFGLLMHENESPPEGTFTSHIQNDIVNNLMSKMRLITEKSLENQRDVKVAKENEYPLSISIQRDGECIICQTFLNICGSICSICKYSIQFVYFESFCSKINT